MNNNQQTVLLTTHHLANFAGSELVIFDLAKELLKLNYDVTVATFIYDNPLKMFFEESNIKVVNILYDDLENTEYDFIWSQHATVLYYVLFEKAIKARKIICSSLSPYEQLETPPIFANHLSLCLVNSEETKKETISLGVAKNNVKVFLNAVPDEYYQYFDQDKPECLKHIIIVSNHIPEELFEMVPLLEEQGIKVDIFGINQHYEMVTADKLIGYDAIITIGRTVQQGFSLGIPVYCYDHFGGPGWIVDSNIDTAEYYNFSGRCTKRRKNAIQIYNEISSGFTGAFAARSKLFNIAKERYSLSNHLTKVLNALSKTGPLFEEGIYQHAEILNKHNQYYVRELKNRILNEQKIAELCKAMSANRLSQLFIDTGSGFNESESIKIMNPKEMEPIVFDLGSFDNIKALRFDPLSVPAVVNLQSVELSYQGQPEVQTRGLPVNATFSQDGADCFFHNDPQYTISLDTIRAKDLVRVTIKMDCQAEGDSAFLDFVGSRIESLEQAVAEKNPEPSQSLMAMEEDRRIDCIVGALSQRIYKPIRAIKERLRRFAHLEEPAE